MLQKKRSVGTAEGSRQWEKQFELHIQEKRRGEQQGVRLESKNDGSIGSSGRGARDVSRTRDIVVKESAASDMLFASEEDAGTWQCLHRIQ